MNRVRQAVILAGGRGTRLGQLTDRLPKPMVDVGGEPFLSHLLRLVATQGVTQVVILTGYLGELIRGYFGAEFEGVSIVYSDLPASNSTGERLVAASSLFDSNFLLLYSDNYVAFDLSSLEVAAADEEIDVVFTVCPKTPGNIVLGNGRAVESYLQDRSAGSGAFVEVGFSLVSGPALMVALENSKWSLPGALEIISHSGRAAAHVVTQPYLSISDPHRLLLTRQFIEEAQGFG